MKKKTHATNVFIKECIAQALMTLLKKKELSAISITELTKVAGVSRMEYYKLLAFTGYLYNLYLGWAKNNFEETPEAMAKILSSLQPSPEITSNSSD